MTRASPVIVNLSNSKGSFSLEVSELKSDYPSAQWLSDVELTSFVKNYMRFALKYLSELGYQGSIRIVRGYSDEAGRFDWSPSAQKSMRTQIMSAYLQSLSPQKAQVRSLTIDYGVKSR
jgi:hypothetical protein